MNIKYFRSIVVSVSLGWLAPWLALAQPVITTQPKTQFLAPGRNASFSVLVSGAAPFNYQWLFDGIAKAGATGSSLSLFNAQPAQSGYYSVIVSNASGSVTSQVAELKVFVAAPHGFSNIQAQSNGSVNLRLKGETTTLFAPYYDLYPVETSTNLVDWAPLVTLQRTNTALDTLQFLDPDAPQFSQRFYRTPTNQLATPDPQPTGPYSVGTFSILLTNTLRNNAKFMVTFWYPAVAQAGVLPAKYVESQVALSGWYDFTSSGGGNFGSQVAAFFSHSLPNAPIATNLAPYPVLLYSPGYSGHRRENTDKTEELASWGYVVIGLDTRNTVASVLPNGSVIYGQPQASSVAGVDADVEAHLQDSRALLDQLGTLNADPRLGGRLDLQRIGIFGFSLGGATAGQLCLRDPRCKAGAGMDGLFFETNLLTQPLSVPFLYFRSGDSPDPNPGSILPFYFPDDRLEVYNEQVTNAYWVKLASTVHVNFKDDGLIIDSASFEGAFGTPMSGQFLSSGRASQIVRAYLLSFFNKFLQGQDDHLLDGPSPAYPEVMQFLSTSSSSAPPEYTSAALVQGSDSNLYGTTVYGGASGNGTVFQVTLAGALTTLVSFNGANGSHPVAALVQGSDGNFYGTTEFGGTNGNNGTVFQMTPAGALTTLISFNGTNGSHPFARLVQGSDGDFYGTTILGGAKNLGTVFKITPGGALTTLNTFNGANGSSPFAALVQSTNGNLYGTCCGGGASGYGTIFQITPGGAPRMVFSFNLDNGAIPAAGLVQGSDGNFYGTTEYGGNLNYNLGNGFGTVFKMSPVGVLTTLVAFTGTNGSYTAGGLVQGSDGNFYGTTDGGGAGGGGTVFKMTPVGVLTTLVAFTVANGSSPSGLVQGSDGNFYGTTGYGGAGGFGTVFRVTPTGLSTTLVAF
jgi:uncharacterized repeat protein (TIGR03803 family)